MEIHVSCDMEECRKRDPHGLYKKALAGEINNFTGLTSPYEAPIMPDLTIGTQSTSVKQCVDMVEEFLITNSIISAKDISGRV
jgi:adenylylsulfate kinase